MWRTDGTEAGTILVKDINRRAAGAGANPSSSAQIGEALFFGTGPGALWRTDGTTAGTERVAQLQEEGSSENRYLMDLVSFRNVLIFVRDGELTAKELWRSDGTSVGTRRLLTFYPGPTGSGPRYLTPIGGTLFFSATGPNGTELWRSDATAAGTVELKDIYPGRASSAPNAFTEFNGQLFFYASHGDGRSGLWRSDGTASGTVPIRELTNSAFHALTKAADQLLFFSSSGTNVMLWSSRGTPPTTVLVGPMPPRTRIVGAASMQLIGRPDVALFASGDDQTGVELWRTDGTLAGTWLVKDIRSGPDSSYPRSFFTAGNVTYFQADHGLHGAELWRTDGTEQGTRLLKDINPGLPTSLSTFAGSRMAEVNGIVFFWAFEPEHGTELWMTDGTEEGTVLVADLNPSRDILPAPNGPGALLTGANGRLYFAADDGVTGNELWTLTVPSRAVLAAIRGANRMVLRAIGEPNQEHIIECSDNLRAWTPVQTNRAGSDGQIHLTNGLDGSAKFFRTRTPVGGAW